LPLFESISSLYSERSLQILVIYKGHIVESSLFGGNSWLVDIHGTFIFLRSIHRSSFWEYIIFVDNLLTCGFGLFLLWPFDFDLGDVEVVGLWLVSCT
jgi:hypothetical protein